MQHPTDSRIVRGDNPFDVPAAHDYFLGPRPDVQLWNETWFFSAWSPQNECGIFIHAGADGADPALFYAQVIIYLPGGKVYADRSWGRPQAGHFSLGGFSITTEEPLRRWRLRYDGAGEVVSSDESGRRPVGAGFALPGHFDIELTAAAPIWDMFKATGLPHADWAGLHHEQTTYSSGEIAVGDESWHFDDGMGFRDHSTGQRDFSHIGGDRFWGWVSPTTKRSFQGIKVWNRQGDLQISSAAYFVDRNFEIINGSIELTGIDDTLGNPKDLELSFTRPNGETIEAKGQIVHTAVITIDDPNHNINGAQLSGDPLILAECQLRFEWPDGDIFYGHLERVARLASLKRP